MTRISIQIYLPKKTVNCLHVWVLFLHLPVFLFLMSLPLCTPVTPVVSHSVSLVFCICLFTPLVSRHHLFHDICVSAPLVISTLKINVAARQRFCFACLIRVVYVAFLHVGSTPYPPDHVNVEIKKNIKMEFLWSNGCVKQGWAGSVCLQNLSNVLGLAQANICTSFNLCSPTVKNKQRKRLCHEPW